MALRLAAISECCSSRARSRSPAGPAWLVQRLLARRGAAGWWPFLGSTTLAISIIGPTWLADGAASVVLIGMHLAVGLVLIAGFNRSVSR